MAMFGTRKKQAFGMMPPMGPYNTPGIGDGMIERQQMGAVSQGMGQLPDITNMPDMQQPEQKTGKRGPSWLGILGDSLQILGGGQASYVPQMQEQRQREQLLRQRALERQQERETGWQDWVKKEEYKRANPDPVNNDTVNDLNWYKGLTEDDRKLYHQMKPVVGYMADGTPRIVNPMEIGQPSRAPQPGTVEDGHEFIGGNPADPKSWRKVGGQPGGTRPFAQ